MFCARCETGWLGIVARADGSKYPKLYARKVKGSMPVRVPCGVCAGCLKDAAGVRFLECLHEVSKARRVFGVLVEGEQGESVSSVAGRLRGFLRSTINFEIAAGGSRGRFVQVGTTDIETGVCRSMALCYGMRWQNWNDDLADDFGLDELHVFDVGRNEIADFAGIAVPGAVPIDTSADEYFNSMPGFFGLGWLKANVADLWPSGLSERHGVRVRMDRCFPLRSCYAAELPLLNLSPEFSLNVGRLPASDSLLPDEGIAVRVREERATLDFRDPVFADDESAYRFR